MSLRPTFLGFETMRKSLMASQKALDITGHNIANVNTVGYSRQRLDLVSIANQAGGLGYKTSVALAGQGVNAVGVTQIRDEFLDKRFRELNAVSADAGTKQKILGDMENVLDFLENDGFVGAYTDFLSSLSAFSADSPARKELASVTITSAEQMVQVIRSYNTKLNQIKDQTEFEMQTGVNRVSEILRQIGDLNKQIKNEYVASGDIFIEGNNYKVNAVYGPNELKDKRNALLDELSNYGNIEVKNNSNGSINVKFAGVSVVEDEKYQTLEMVKHSQGTVSLQFKTLSGNVTPVSSGTGSLESGALKGYLDMYNGAGTYYNDIYTRAAGMKELASNLNDALAKMATMNVADRTTYFNDNIAALGDKFVLNPDGSVEVDGNTILSAYTAGTASSVNKLVAMASSDNTSLKYSVVTFSGTNNDVVHFTDVDTGNGTMKTTLDETAISTFSSERGIVYYQKTVDALANTIAQAYNQAASSVDQTTGEAMLREMFSSEDGGPINAGNIKISDRWKANPSMITQKVEWADDTDHSKGTKDVEVTGEELWTGYINKLQAVSKKSLKFTIDGSNVNSTEIVVDKECTIDSYYSFVAVSRLGQDLEYQQSAYDSADIMASNVSDSRDATMSVSIDEEGVNMLSFQKWYNASARMITTLDEALNTIINGMGLVGRA